MENTPVLLEERDSGVVQTPHHTEGPPLENSSEPLTSTPRNHKFLQLDSNDLITVQVDQVLFRVSADIFRLCSAVNENSAHPLTLSGITAPRLSSFLTMAATKTVRANLALSLDDLISTLHAATQLKCDEIRKYTINSINKQVASLEAVPLIQLGLRYQVYSWAREGFTRLIERDAPLSSEEGTSLGMELVLAIYRNRETFKLARSQGDHKFNTGELIKKEPSLRNPKFEKLEDIEFPASANTFPASEDPLHYRSDLINLLVDDTVWTVSMATLGFTPYFVGRTEESEMSGAGGWPTVDISGEVERAELEAYLTLVNARRFRHSSGETLGFSFQEWVSALRLATVFGHSDARRFAISFLGRQLMDHDPFDVIDAAKTCNVDQWLEPQYVRIAKRGSFPSEQEGRRLGVTSLLALCKLREQSAYNSGKTAGTLHAMQAPCATCNGESGPSKKEKKKKADQELVPPVHPHFPALKWEIPKMLRENSHVTRGVGYR
ncbi:hypothetical protein M407DRAFT_31528 [Tulasnella calospora MUT 4182]|uniref:BTB domain-containing protein n=1 Tax=Tulasnella calospora MUT 4182 TaxID=1051891 RepID=A0A0C3Q6B2_9AGAM|nr:hypothetical protein M407DRAFT_31528 [Tulasnella calospora MUT 4182]